MEDQLVNNEKEDELSVRTKSDLQYNNNDNTPNDEANVLYFEDVDSSCSTPFVSAPTSPDRAESVNFGAGFFYSAPASPMHFVLCSVSPKRTPPLSEPSVSFDFGFSARHGTNIDSVSGSGSMSSADELFFNGQIRPMKNLSSHQQPRKKNLAPLPDLDESEGEQGIDDASDIVGRGRDLKCNDRSLRRRARSTSPLRKSSFQWLDVEEEEAEKTEIIETIEDKNNDSSLGETTPSMSTSSSRSSSTNRNSKKWLFLKDLLHRSKSEGSNNGQRFWSSISFSPIKDRKPSPNEEKKNDTTTTTAESAAAEKKKGKKPSRKVVMNGVAGKSRSRAPMSAHELHYKASRAQTEEMRKKTFLPYKQGVLGCLGFSSKSYGAMNGFARALNPVSSR